MVALVALVLVSLLLVHRGGSQNAKGFPGYLGAFTDRYPVASGTALDDCTTCHVVPGGPRNPYGQAVEAELDAGKDIDEALAAVESEDSDGDGASNLEEITALTAPGDPADSPVVVTPTPAATPPPPTSPAASPTPPAASPTPPAASPTPPAAAPASPTATPSPAAAPTPAPTGTPAEPPAGGGPPDGGHILDSTETYVLLALAGLAAAIGVAFVSYYLAKPKA